MTIEFSTCLWPEAQRIVFFFVWLGGGVTVMEYPGYGVGRRTRLDHVKSPLFFFILTGSISCSAFVWIFMAVETSP